MQQHLGISSVHDIILLLALGSSVKYALSLETSSDETKDLTRKIKSITAKGFGNSLELQLAAYAELMQD